MTLAAQITSDVAAVFLQTDDFAETVIHYDGLNGTEETIAAVVDYDELENSGGEGAGDAMSTDRNGRVRTAATLEIPAGIRVTEERGNNPASTWLIDGSVWTTKRVTGKDHAMQSVKVVRTDSNYSRRATQ